MLTRVLEPEVMDTPQEAEDYDRMDHAEVNRRFVRDFLTFVTRENNAPFESILDVGTGTAQIPIEFCRQHPLGTITAIDLSQEMLKLGRQNVAASGFTERIRLELIDAKQLPYADGQFQAVISNSIIHHIPEPPGVFAEMKRVLQLGGVLFVRDLLRPCDETTLDELVQTYAGQENAHQRQMFRDSLRAALSLEEVRDMLDQLSLPRSWAEQTSDRHWTIAGRLSF